MGLHGLLQGYLYFYLRKKNTGGSREVNSTNGYIRNDEPFQRVLAQASELHYWLHSGMVLFLLHSNPHGTNISAQGGPVPSAQSPRRTPW
jgi:hypothetical protein